MSEQELRTALDECRKKLEQARREAIYEVETFLEEHELEIHETARRGDESRCQGPAHLDILRSLLDRGER